MQWLIDIVYEMVMAAIGPHNPFVDAGDIPDFQWRTADFNTNGAWHDLSLVDHIPVGTKAVLFHLYLMDNLVQSNILFRTKDNAKSYNIASCRTQVANVYIAANFIVTPDADRKIQYYATNTVFSTIWLSVRGWWI